MPVPAIVKATLIFECAAKGWSESFLWLTNSSDLNLETPSIQIIAAKRAAFLGKEAFVKAERLSFERNTDGLPVVGDSVLAYVRYDGQGQELDDDPDTAILVTMRNLAATRRRNTFLRGIWDTVNVSGGKLNVAEPGFVSAYNAWRSSMLARQIGWWHSTRASETLIDGYEVDPDTGFVQVTLKAAVPGFVPNALMEARIAGVNGKSPINGQQLIRVIDSTHFWLEKPLALVNYKFGGKLITYTRDFEQVGSMDPQKIVTRRAGAPLLESRGRGRARTRA